MKGISKFTKASNWASTSTPKLTETGDTSKIPDSETFPWNTLGILKNTLGLNFLSLNEEKGNPWTPLVTGKLISPSGTPDTGTLLSKHKTPEDNTDRSLRNLYEGTSNLRFGSDTEDNPFQQPSDSRVPILPTFPT